MRIRLVYKILIIGIILLTVFQGNFSADAESINTEVIQEENLDRPKIGIYPFCEICTINNNGGRAFLFPGYLESVKGETQVRMASGFCKPGDTTYTGILNINGKDFNNWQWMIISAYTGLLENYWITPPGLNIPVFRLDGNAGFVIISYFN